MKRKIIAVTGLIGSGKSAVMSILSQMGYATVNCDEIARQVATDPDVIRSVSALLGEQSVVNGALDRKYIRDKVFADGKLLDKYGSIFYGRVKRLLQQRVDQLPCGVVFVEIVVLNAFEFDWTEIWQVVAPSGSIVPRVIQRDGVSEQNVLQILNSQSAPRRYTRLIDNGGSVADLKQQVLRALAEAQLNK